MKMCGNKLCGRQCAAETLSLWVFFYLHSSDFIIVQIFLQKKKCGKSFSCNNATNLM